nr:reticulon-4b isoform X1 [Misgurnus anguillicaudatus]XP_055026617.1 reticulon-4b isoform X1 [Misgurnus anguillicaudatus]XP_055026618.1 reticulon-4b isoform X1 [Misgurnus anguillicaudatus]
MVGIYLITQQHSDSTLSNSGMNLSLIHHKQSLQIPKLLSSALFPMDEGDKVSSCTPDELLKNQSDKSMQHADDKIIAPQTNEENVFPQTNETFITSHTISVENIIPQAVEISISLKTTEVTVTAHRVEETSTSQTTEDTPEITQLNNTSHQETEVTWTSQRTGDAAERSPQHPEVSCVSEIKEEFIALKTSDVTSEISEVTASLPAISDVSSTSAADVESLQTERNTHLISGDLEENKPSLHTHERALLSAPTSSVSAFVSAPQFSADLWGSPAVVSQDNNIPTMDSFSKISGGFESDFLNQADDDLLVEPKNSIFSSDNDAKEGLTATRRSVEVSDSPSPDLVQDAYDGDGNEDFTQPQEIEQFSVSSVNKEADDRPTTLPDILKSSPLNPDKADSGSSEGSPDFSPAHKSEDSQNLPLSVSASNLFEFDSKILLLKEMAEETEARAVEKAKLDAEKISEQSFVAFDLVKETGLPLKSDQLLKDKEAAEMSSQTYVQMSDKFECLNFLNEKIQEHSDSDSPTADSFSPVLDAVAKQTSCFPVEQGNTAFREEIEAIDEVSEQEVSSEEFEFVERPPQGVPDEFQELHDSSTIPKPSEMPVDDEQSPNLELPYQIPATQDTEDQSSCHLLSQQSDDSFPMRGKVGLESVPQDISPVSLNHTPVDKTGFEKNEDKVSSNASLRPATVLDLLYWRNLRSSAVVFGSSLLLLLSISTCSIITVITYMTLALLSVTVSIRIYKGILQAILKSDEGHPFKQYLDKDVGLSKDLVQKYSDMALGQINSGLIELRHLFLVEDLVDSLKFAVFLWIMTYVGAVFNGLTLLILGLIGAFSCPVIYEKHQTEIDQYISMVKNQIKDILGKIQAKVPGMKKLE